MSIEGDSKKAASCPVQHEKQSECPVDHTSKEGGCPVKHNPSEQAPQAAVAVGDSNGSCPVQHSGSGAPANHPFASIHNALSGSTAGPSTTSNNKTSYNEAANDMEFSNKKEFNDQSQLLKSGRSVSTIPKSDFTPGHQPSGFDKWVYPSEQQYYNAMKRKGYNPDESDVPVILSIHNLVNEQGWSRVKEWELIRGCTNPKLKRFLGRPNDISPKAYIMSTFLGYTKPFDRHDWIVDRDGEEVRYVIDFYAGRVNEEQQRVFQQQMMYYKQHGHPNGPPPMPVAIHLDVRPAMDSYKAIFDRAYRYVKELFGPEDSLKRLVNQNSKK